MCATNTCMAPGVPSPRGSLRSRGGQAPHPADSRLPPQLGRKETTPRPSVPGLRVALNAALSRAWEGTVAYKINSHEETLGPAVSLLGVRIVIHRSCNRPNYDVFMRVSGFLSPPLEWKLHESRDPRASMQLLTMSRKCPGLRWSLVFHGVSLPS